jgi:hypothetical protein
MNWLELLLTLVFSPIIDHLTDEEVVELAINIQRRFNIISPHDSFF